MLQGEHSAILSTFIKLPFVIKIFVCLFLDVLHDNWDMQTLLYQAGCKLPLITKNLKFLNQKSSSHCVMLLTILQSTYSGLLMRHAGKECYPYANELCDIVQIFT